MKRRVLIVLNTQFPYGKSEDFLSNELDYVSGFDEIVCFPILVYGLKGKNDIIYPKFNKLISFYNSAVSYKNVSRAFKLFFLIFTSFSTYKELFYLLHTGRFTLGNLKVLLSFLLISYNAIDDLSKIINNKYRDCDIVLYSYWMHIGAFSIIELQKRFQNIINIEKLITRCHRFDLYEYAQNGNYLPMREHIFSNIDEIHSISDDGIGYLKKTYPYFDESKLYLSRLGTKDRGVKIFPKVTTLHLVSCSWMRPVKRVGTIVEAIRKLPLKLEWVHYGDGEEFTKIEKLVKQIDNPLISCVLKGAYRNDKVLEEYAVNHYDVFINVSENEGVPVSIMEAMSFGKIIIATDVGGTSEIVEDGVNGFLLNKDFKNSELAEIISKISNLSSAKFDIMCRNSRRIWENKCNAEINYKSFYKGLE